MKEKNKTTGFNASGGKRQEKARSDTNTSSHVLWQWMVASVLLPQSIFPFFSVLKASTLAFQFLPVCCHSPSISTSHSVLLSTPLTPPWPSSQCVSTPSAVISTLSGLAGEKRQSAGGGPGLPECVATPPSPWHRHRILCYGWVFICRSERTLRRRDEREWGCPLCGSSHCWVTESLPIWTAWIVLCLQSYKPQTDFTSASI